MTSNMDDIFNNSYNIVKENANLARIAINETFSHLEPWQLIISSAAITYIGCWLWDFIFDNRDSLYKRFLQGVFTLIKTIPFVKNKIKKQLEATVSSIEESFDKSTKGHGYIKKLPEKGLSHQEVLNEIENYKKMGDIDWNDGRCSGCVYSANDDLTSLMGKVFTDFLWTNPLHPDVFPDIRKMEAEVVRMTCNMFNGSPKTCGSMTTGGTESILLACKVYRDLAFERGVKYPEMLIPVTAHAAFDKAGQYFCINVVHAPIDDETGRVNLKAMKRLINRSTCMLVGSAPSYPRGVIDDIAEISKLGVKYNLPVHVDCCLGGFLVPFMKKAGYPLPPFDFSVCGVTSISADTHKYGFAPKGSSVIMYIDEKYRKKQYFVQPDWPGGIYASPTFTGSRAGAIIASCWATMMYFGHDGYVESTRKIVDVARHIEKEAKQVKGIFVYGKPDVSVISFGSSEFNIYRLSDALTKLGWNLNALQFPSSFHICITMQHVKTNIAGKFLRDLRRCTAEIMKNPKAAVGGQAALYGVAQSIPDRSLVSEIAGSYFRAYYGTNSSKKKK